jgi:hypothetical protein
MLGTWVWAFIPQKRITVKGKTILLALIHSHITSRIVPAFGANGGFQANLARNYSAANNATSWQEWLRQLFRGY